MRVCSFDVGFKNLAYCCIDKKDDDSFDILYWGIINLGDDELKCSFKIKRGGEHECGKKAFFCTNNDGTKCGYCKTHKDKYMQPSFEDICESCDDKKCNYCNKNNKICNKKSKFKINDKYYCKAHATMIYNNNYDIKKYSSSKETKNNVQDIAIKLYKNLDKFVWITDVDEIYIENQPSMKNPKMKTIASLLYGYFILRGKIDKNRIENIKFISPSNKLKVNKKKTDKMLDDGKENDKNVYKITKNLGIKYCKALIKNNKKANEILNQYKKKDDMCDAFLQGYYCLFCSNGISKELKKIMDDLE